MIGASLLVVLGMVMGCALACCCCSNSFRNRGYSNKIETADDLEIEPTRAW